MKFTRVQQKWCEVIWSLQCVCVCVHACLPAFQNRFSSIITLWNTHLANLTTHLKGMLNSLVLLIKSVGWLVTGWSAYFVLFYKRFNMLLSFELTKISVFIATWGGCLFFCEGDRQDQCLCSFFPRAMYTVGCCVLTCLHPHWMVAGSLRHHMSHKVLQHVWKTAFNGRHADSLTVLVETEWEH